MPNSKLFRLMNSEIGRLKKTYLNFRARPHGDYTRRQLSAAAAYTVFCHAEFESYLEGWATFIIDFVDTSWRSKIVTRPLVHLCTFNNGREALTEIPRKDIWSEQIVESIRKHRTIIRENHGIKEHNICKLLSPLGFDVRQIDPVLIGDMNAFGGLRGDHVHQSHRLHVGNIIDPFGRQGKVEGLLKLLACLDISLDSYFTSCKP